MPAKSQKQARFFRLVRGVQKGDVSKSKVSSKVKKVAKSMSAKDVKDFIKVKEIVEKYLNEAEYSLSKMREVNDKTLEQLLFENTGVPFDKNELLTFQNKQIGFGGFGKINFVHKNSTNEINGQVFSHTTTKTYVFKKLTNNENEGLYNYACFIELRAADQDKDRNRVLYTLSSIFDNNDEQKTKVLSDFIERINSYGL